MENMFTSMVNAQVTKTDVTKTPSKTTIWFQKQKANCEKIMKDIQDSQFGQFVGDGIKYTKEGIKYAQAAYKRGMELYNQVLDSDEYKAAMKSKEIAQESLKLKEMQEEKLKKQEDIQAEIDLLKEQTAAKITTIRQNIDILEQQSKMSKKAKTRSGETPVSAQAIDSLPDAEDEEIEKSEEMASIEAEIEEVQNITNMQLEDYESEMNDIEEEYQEKIIEQGKLIAKLTQELAELASSSFKKKEPRDATEALQETQDNFLSLTAPSIKEAKKIKKRRKEALSTIIVETITNKSDKHLTRSTKEDNTASTADLGETMPGESEGSGISAEVLSDQLQVLRSYIDVVLADLKLQTSMELNNLRQITSEPLKTKFNLCNYTDQSNVGLEGIKKKAIQAKETLTDAADQVKNTVGQAQDMADQAKSAIGQVKDMADQAKSAVGQVKDMASQATDVVQGIQEQYSDIDISTVGSF